MNARRRLRKRYPTEREGSEQNPWLQPAAEVPVAAGPDVAGAAAPVVVEIPPVVEPKPAGAEPPPAESEPVEPEATAADIVVDGPEPAEIEVAPAAAESAPAAEIEASDAEPVAVADPARLRRQRLIAVLLGLLLPLIAFGTGLALFNNLVMPRLIHGVGQVRVPELTNLNLEQAEQALTSSGLQLSRAGERFDPGVPRGFVLSQDPAAGTEVRGRKRVSVMVSLGEEFSSVPELFGESERGAFLLLKGAGVRPGRITRAPSEDVGEGLVVATDPPAASVLPHAQSVALLISIGEGEVSFVMPELSGREIAGVRRQLEALGFRVITPAGGPSLGTIVSQNPAPGSRIMRATTITLEATGRIIR
ncbi:MAG TPA: PASTA domain-containing protein [Candidatus Limnocylindria bacterium]|nr:PASTA domain-containing protein [Candidatus Limnocylindria bacterium]